MINNKNTNIIGVVLFIASLIYIFIPIFVKDFNVQGIVLITLLTFGFIGICWKNTKIQAMFVKIIGKLTGSVGNNNNPENFEA